MRRHLTILIVLVACVALAAPTWAQLENCPNESRNGDFEVGQESFTGEDYNGTGVTAVKNTTAPDHWTMENVSWSTAKNHTVGGQYSILGDGGYLWQIVDDTRAYWNYLNTTDGWDDDANECWDGLADAKTLGAQYWGLFNDWENQAIELNIYGWQGAGAPSGITPGNPASDWTGITSLDLTADSPAAEGLWQNAQGTFQINFQPQYTAFVFSFTDPNNAGVYLDDAVFKGKCIGSDSPEPATWVLLAATGIFGVIRRRRDS